MKMGSFATIGAQAPSNLVHIVLDNGVHESTGGQATVSRGVDLRIGQLIGPLHVHGFRAAGVCVAPGRFATDDAGETIVRIAASDEALEGLLLDRTLKPPCGAQFLRVLTEGDLRGTGKRIQRTSNISTWRILRRLYTP